MIQLTDLLTPATSAQIRASIVAALVSMGIPANQWRTSGSLSSMLTAICVQLANFSVAVSQAVGGFYLPYSVGGWLTLLAYYVYGVTRIPATFPQGAVLLTNLGGAIFSGPSYAPGQVTFQDPSTGNTFVNTQQITLGAVGTSTAQQTITVQGTTAGSAGSAGAGAITTIVTTMLGVTCTNPSAVVGVDAQSDPDLRTQCIASRAANSVRGPATAYAFYAKYTLGPGGISLPLTNSLGATVNINRTQPPPPSHTGQVVVTLASPSGAVSSVDLAAATANIQANAYVSGTTLTVQSATDVPYAPTLVIYCQSVPGLQSASVASAITPELTAFLSLYPIGGIALPVAAPSGVQQGLFGSEVQSVIEDAVETLGSRVVLITGLTDLALVNGQVAVNDITFTLQMVG